MRAPEQQPSGRWKVRFRLGGKQTSETFELRRDAERFCKLLDVHGPYDALEQLHQLEGDAIMPTLDKIAASHIALLTGVEKPFGNCTQLNKVDPTASARLARRAPPAATPSPPSRSPTSSTPGRRRQRWP